jgi:hypothetical protein
MRKPIFLGGNAHRRPEDGRSFASLQKTAPLQDDLWQLG